MINGFASYSAYFVIPSGVRNREALLWSISPFVEMTANAWPCSTNTESLLFLIDKISLAQPIVNHQVNQRCTKPLPRRISQRRHSSPSNMRNANGTPSEISNQPMGAVPKNGCNQLTCDTAATNANSVAMPNQISLLANMPADKILCRRVLQIKTSAA